MKFSQTLALNANPDWEGRYLDYAGLKKLINEWSNNEQAQQHHKGLDEDPSFVFLQTIEQQMFLIRDFYYENREEMDNELSVLQGVLQPTMIESPRDMSRQASLEEVLTPIDEFDETTPILDKRKGQDLYKLSTTDLSPSEVEEVRRQICELYTKYHNLYLYASLNSTAVGKILKKFDKLMNASLRKNHLDRLVKSIFPFAASVEREVKDQMMTLQRYFSHLCCNDDLDEAEKQMKLMLREYVTFQRHSVWLDVIQDGRKRDTVHASSASPDTQREKTTALATLQTSTPLHSGLICLAIFLGLLFAPGIFHDEPVKRNALALFVFVSLLWAAEVLPLFVTSMMVPFLAVILRVVVVQGVRLSSRETSDFVFSAMFSHVIMLLLGGFSIAAALSKYNIAKIAASAITRRCGNGIRTVLLVHMSIATIASMWISNVAAPVLCYSLITPILKAASAERSRASFGASQWEAADVDRRLSRALVMGIALASNVGGMASPISSPQNLFALQHTPIGWLSWFAVSIPLCIVLNLVIWAWLVYCFQLPRADSPAVSWALQRERAGSSDSWTLEQYAVIAVSVGVVLLWCSSMELSQFFGDMGVLGIVPFAIFFGLGLLSKDDLNNFLWSVVVLAMGGLVLGEVVTTSGLLEVVAGSIARFIEENNLTVWSTLSIFTALILFFTSFCSHTVGAIVVLPIAAAVGSNMEPSHAKELVFGGALVCSAAMGLPVSGFPNMTAVSVEDNLGNRFLPTRDFLKIAVPASIICWLIIITFGYALICASL
eukprot:CAMPEP_0168727390 /NCGR_PEP_ID=MMETSP0724-20121128/5154_1 /TAXON_ID=265536 /ORGANISM="Amphiprora sp., Strain CCMP467" /LENGTH=773 /DNA_ID=CAMNT_0008774223 /DNA_START=131 /DNA_END=2452 /DNA_ORIENTATION=-